MQPEENFLMYVCSGNVPLNGIVTRDTPLSQISVERVNALRHPYAHNLVNAESWEGGEVYFSTMPLRDCPTGCSFSIKKRKLPTGLKEGRRASYLPYFFLVFSLF